MKPNPTKSFSSKTYNIFARNAINTHYCSKMCHYFIFILAPKYHCAQCYYYSKIEFWQVFQQDCRISCFYVRFAPKYHCAQTFFYKFLLATSTIFSWKHNSELHHHPSVSLTGVGPLRPKCHRAQCNYYHQIKFLARFFGKYRTEIACVLSY